MGRWEGGERDGEAESVIDVRGEGCDWLGGRREEWGGVEEEWWEGGGVGEGDMDDGMMIDG